jgi:hypothetical protein
MPWLISFSLDADMPLAALPPHFLEGIQFDIRLALEVIGAVFAVRLCRLSRTTPFRLLAWAFLCLAVPQVTLFLFTGLGRLLSLRDSRFLWIYWADPISVDAFLVLIILSLRGFLREHRASTTRNV